MTSADALDVDELLAEIAGRGLSVTADGADLRLLGPREKMDADLVARIRAGKPALLRALTGPPQKEGGAATLLQRSYLLGRTGSADDEVASHVYHEIGGSWDLRRLQRALDDVVAHHDALRTRFTPAGRRVVEPGARVRIEVLDLRHLDPAAQEAELLRQRAERSHRVLPAHEAPLLAVALSVLHETRMRLHVGHDGLAMDGISMFLFFQEWGEGHQCDGAGSDEGFPAFDDYVDALAVAGTRAPARRSQEAWFERIDGLPPHPKLPVLPDAAGNRFVRREIRLDAARFRVLLERAAAEGVTPAALLLAAYAETLSYWGTDRAMTITTTLADRPPIHPGMARSIGQYSDVLLVAVDPDPEADVRERVRSVHARLRRDLDNRHFSGLEVLRELQRRGRSARMPYTFNCTLGHPAASGSALSAFGEQVYGVSQTPGVWLNVFVMEQDGELVVQLDAVDAMFPEGIVDAVSDGYRAMIESLLDEVAWSEPAADLMPQAQRRSRAEVNATAAPIPALTAADRIMAAAAATPDAAAVLTAHRVLTYGELARRATAAAAWLRAAGVGRDELVGLVVRRGPEQLVGILATALAGAAYLPVDADLPARRREYMLSDGAVRCVISNVITGGVPDDRDTLVIDLDGPVPDLVAVPPPLPGASQEDLLYVLYTSGTTGEPKGVMISHRSVVNLVADCTTRFSITAADRFFGISAFNFDLSVFDVFGALGAGAAVVMPDHDRATDPGHWLELCARFGVTVWNSVPAIVAMLAEQAADQPQALAALRLVMMSGDRIPPALPVALRELLPTTELVSLGGPTETTVWNILHPIVDVGDGQAPVPYGRPNANNRCYVLDDAGRERPDWVVGEICAAGAGVARGYWNAPERTAARFVDHAALSERIYRTGDLGHHRPDGEVVILGRKDFQIKINGYRIEAGEVESRLAAIDGVRQAVVVRQDSAVGARLVGHVACDPGTAFDEAAVQARLREALPAYMVPSAFVVHAELPLTRNGKVDRGELVAATAPALVAAAAPDGPLEQELAQLWGAVLGVDVLDVTAGFFDLGGDSLAAARVLGSVRKQYGTAIVLDEFYLVATVRELAARITGAAAS
ncbi:MAG: amino acid adenylation domain-containing protein [Frankiaceae bacterium]|nr:amino acid adenylation domain-containing protein [Frankiaceae bacterium]